MAKASGFMDFTRKNNISVQPLERIKNFNEFHIMLPEEERKMQSARCMNCGVPFCQSSMVINGMTSGCPLNNLIPEWNDAVYTDNMQEALSRLLKTNNFPEFTARVCPALCEIACTCNVNYEPVSIKENELSIIEYAFENGLMNSDAPINRSDRRVAVVGSGPAGLACADMLNKRGHNVVVYEKSDYPGGLLMYGIPTMKLEKDIIKRRVELMEKQGVEFITNTNIGVDITAQTLLDSYDAVVLCCGAEKPRKITAQGMEDAENVYYAVDFLSRNTKSYVQSSLSDNNYINAQGKNVVVIGGGDTGNDCVGTVIRHGCKSVVQLEMMPKLPDERAENNPWPEYPKVCKVDYGQEEAIAVFGSDPRIYSTTVKAVNTDENKNITSVEIVEIAFDDNRQIVEVAGSQRTIPCDIMLIAAGFVGCNDYVAESFGIELTARNTLSAGENSYKTSSEKVFVAGDARRGQSLVVWAIAEGRECAKEVDEYLAEY